MYKVRHEMILEIEGDDKAEVDNLINYIEWILDDKYNISIESTETTHIKGE